jgi:hypothetical protein
MSLSCALSGHRWITSPMNTNAAEIPGWLRRGLWTPPRFHPSTSLNPPNHPTLRSLLPDLVVQGSHGSLPLIPRPSYAFSLQVRCSSRLVAMTDATRSAIIKEKPIAHGLDAFRDSAQSLSRGFDASSSTGVPGRIDDESKDLG